MACNFGSNYLRSSIVFQDQGDLELYSEIDIYLKGLSSENKNTLEKLSNL